MCGVAEFTRCHAEFVEVTRTLALLRLSGQYTQDMVEGREGEAKRVGSLRKRERAKELVVEERGVRES